MISSVVSDTFGVSSVKMIQHIPDNPGDTDFDVFSMLHLATFQFNNYYQLNLV